MALMHTRQTRALEHHVHLIAHTCAAQPALTTAARQRPASPLAGL
jgi:hypothetical protein